jgi:hypothetical protein
MKCPKPLHGLCAFSNKTLDAFTHLPRRFVGKGYGKYFPSARLTKR